MLKRTAHLVIQNPVSHLKAAAMSDKKQLTTSVGAPAADNQLSLTAGTSAA
jgi:hypothetical protein